MQYIRNTFLQVNKRITSAMLVLFILHFSGINAIANVLEICFEQNGDINVESVVGAFITIPAEDAVHAAPTSPHSGMAVGAPQSAHSDISFSSVWLKEQHISRFNQQRTLQYLDGIVNTTITELPGSRVFQFASFIPPLIEDFITANLQTVVLLN